MMMVMVLSLLAAEPFSRYNSRVGKPTYTDDIQKSKKAIGTQKDGMIKSDRYEEVINVSDFHKTLCESRNRGVKLKEFPRWKERIEPINSLNSSISSIRIRHEINSPFVSSQAKSYYTNVIYKDKKSKRHYLRKKHIQNRQSPQLRWIIEDNDRASLYEDEHEQKQRLRRIQLKKKRNWKRKKRWDKQRKYLIKMASSQNVAHADSTQASNVPHNNIEPGGVDMDLATLWKDRHESHRENIEINKQRLNSQNSFLINVQSPINDVRTSARKALKKQNRDRHSYHAYEKINRKIEVQKKRRRKKPKRDKNWLRKEKPLEEKEKLIKRREKLRETYAAFKAMTSAVEKAHMVVKSNVLSTAEGDDVTNDLRTKEKNLLTGFQRQQKRLILEMKRMTRLLNESKAQVYGSDV